MPNGVPPEVEAIGQLHFEGNIIPHSWYQSIQNESGKADLVAIILLADIIYWYRPTIIRDDATGAVVEVRKKFAAHSLQKSYGPWGAYFGLTRRQTKYGVDRLVSMGLITREFLAVTTKAGMHLGNVMYIRPCPEAVRSITYIPLPPSPTKIRKRGYPKSQEGVPENVRGGTPNRKTYTEITTETTTQTTTEVPAHSEVRAPSEESEPRYVDMIGDSIEEEINPKSRFTPKDNLGQRILDRLWSSKSWASAAQLRAWNKAKDKFPFDWMQSHFEQAQKHRWSRQGFLKAILNEDAFREWAGIELRRLSQTGGGLTEKAKRLRQSLDPELPHREAAEPEQKTPVPAAQAQAYTAGEEIPF